MDLDQLSRSLAREKIIEMISYLELRIKINAQLIVPIESIRLKVSNSGLGPLNILESVYATNHRAERVIHECDLSIKKLMLFRKVLPELTKEAILDLFDQYTHLSLEDFQRHVYHTLDTIYLKPL
ncbi:MAG: hypothetical protein AAFP19_01940 [Bacteroidota bacterium]